MNSVIHILVFLFYWQNHFNHVQTDWPLINHSTIDLLGLFLYPPNTTQPTILFTHPEAMYKAAILLSQDYNITIDGKYISWQTIQTGGDAMNCLKSTCKLLFNSNIAGIVGLAYSRETDILAVYAETVNFPIISYSATNTDLSARNQYTSFFRTVSSDKAAALALVDLFLRYNWHQERLSIIIMILV